MTGAAEGWPLGILILELGQPLNNLTSLRFIVIFYSLNFFLQK